MRTIALSVILFALMIPAAYAHPPSNVDVSFTDAGKVQVLVTHAVGNPKQHYINKIEVSVNGEKVAEKEYTGQTGNQQIDAFDIPGLQKGDKVEARAYCNKGGDRKGEMTVE
jgi:desulfoferrodoxin (superoxide reductase-like protein)